ncbi:MAG TPA: hypothetical protein VMT92_11140 [Steroidobacteraceae bacterium]|nr:hypothetical protein [Steroidobacteraceae bacterium]
MRVGLIDSGADRGRVVAARRFAADGAVAPLVVPDPTGHGTRVAQRIAAGRDGLEFVLGQVFEAARPTSALAVAAALDWCIAEGARLVHLSLGLAADRAPLAAAVARAAATDCLIVAATPARGGPVYPAAYPRVIRATGDARCRAGELSCLGPATFGGDLSSAAGGRGASIGAAAVSAALLALMGPGLRYEDALAALAARSRYDGPERRAAGGGA